MTAFSSSGQCLCGSVRFTASAPAAEVGLCHCKMCRRWSGGMPLTVIQAAVSLQQQETLTWWKSSDWGERGFCAACGTPLFWRTVGEDYIEEGWAVSAGALDDESGLKITEHIFYDDKAGFYETADEAPRRSGAEFTASVFRQFAARFGEDSVAPMLAQCRAHAGDAFADAVERHLKQGEAD